jgi:hypothetical protein
MRWLVLLSSLVTMAGCAGAVGAKGGAPPEPANVADTLADSPGGAPTTTAMAPAGDSLPLAAPPSSPPAIPPAPANTPVVRGLPPSAEAGRFKAELLQHKEFRLVFDDVQRLGVALDFREPRWGLLKVTVGPGLATVSSAGFNLERLYRAYRAASYFNRDVVVELWRNGAKIGEVTDDGVLVGPEFSVPRVAP